MLIGARDRQSDWNDEQWWIAPYILPLPILPLNISHISGQRISPPPALTFLSLRFVSLSFYIVLKRISGEMHNAAVFLPATGKAQKRRSERMDTEQNRNRQ